MALDDFLEEDESSNEEQEDEISGNKRRFTRFTKKEFEQCLHETFLYFEEVKYDWTNEIVYEAESKNGNFIIRCFSSLDRRTGELRDKGSDAIRLVVLHEETGRPVVKEKRTNRIKTWCKNLKQKIENIKNRKDEIKICSECGSVMVIRENSDSGNKFWGCTSYPDCSNTESIQ